MGVTLKGVEIVCVKALAKCFEENRSVWTSPDGWEEIGLTAENYGPVLDLMEMCGAIENVTHTMGDRFAYFTITPQAVQIAREIEAQDEQRQAKEKEGKDIVEHVKVTLRKHPVMGWLCVVAIALVAVATALNQFLSLFKNLGWI
jgi:hypothetical protein